MLTQELSRVESAYILPSPMDLRHLKHIGEMRNSYYLNSQPSVVMGPEGPTVPPQRVGLAMRAALCVQVLSDLPSMEARTRRNGRQDETMEERPVILIARSEDVVEAARHESSRAER